MVHFVPVSFYLALEDVGKCLRATCFFHQLLDTDLADLLMTLFVAELVIHADRQLAQDSKLLRADELDFEVFWLRCVPRRLRCFKSSIGNLATFHVERFETLDRLFTPNNLLIDDIFEILPQQARPDDRWPLRVFVARIALFHGETARRSLTEEGLGELGLLVWTYLMAW